LRLSTSEGEMAGRSRTVFGLSRAARVGVFAALSYGINAPLLAIPNIELFSLGLFLSGVFLGAIDGLATAIVAGIILVFFNPNGPQTIFLVGLAQLIGFALFGLGGGALRRLVLRNGDPRRVALILTVVGAILTFWYDLSTNLAFALFFGPFWPVMIGGLGFGVLHIVSNGVIFGASSLVIQRIWKRIEYFMPPLAG